MIAPILTLPQIAVLLIQGTVIFALLAFLRQSFHLQSVPVWGILSLYPLSLLVQHMLAVRNPHPLVRRAAGTAAGILAAGILWKTQLYPAFLWTDMAWLKAAGAGLLAAIYGLTPEIATATACAVCWILGGRLGRRPVDFTAVAGSFQFGFVIFVVAIVSADLSGADTGFAIPLLPIFFLSGLAGLFSLRLREMPELRNRGRLTWILLAAVGLSATLLLAGSIALLVHPELLDRMLAVGTAVFKAILHGIFRILEWLASFLPERQSVPLPGGVPAPGGQGEPENWVQWLRIPDEVRSTLRFLVSLAWLTLLLVAAWHTCSQVLVWIQRRFLRRPDIRYESIEGTFRVGLWVSILSALRRIAFWGRRILGLPSRSFRTPARDSLSIARNIYFRLEKWARSAGYVRRPFQTPHEFLRRLVEVFPDLRWEFTFITQQFAGARYGPIPPGENALDKMRINWKKVRKYRRPKTGKSQRRNSE